VAVKVTLQIDELVLDGFPAADRHRIADAVERELGRLLAERGLPQSWSSGGATDRVDAGEIAPAPDGRATTGHDIARALYRGFTQ
jgi:hypothetical protein